MKQVNGHQAFIQLYLYTFGPNRESENCFSLTSFLKILTLNLGFYHEGGADNGF